MGGRLAHWGKLLCKRVGSTQPTQQERERIRLLSKVAIGFWPALKQANAGANVFSDARLCWSKCLLYLYLASLLTEKRVYGHLEYGSRRQGMFALLSFFSR